MQPFLNVLVFNVWLPKGEKEKEMKEGRKSVSPLNPLEVTSTRRGSACHNGGKVQQCLPSFLHLCGQKQQLAIMGQILDIWWIFTLAPTTCMPAAPETHAQVPATGLGMRDGNCYCTRVEIHHINCNLLSKTSPASCKPSVDSRVPKYIRQILPCNCCPGGETDS